MKHVEGQARGVLIPVENGCYSSGAIVGDTSNGDELVSTLLL